MDNLKHGPVSHALGTLSAALLDGESASLRTRWPALSGSSFINARIEAVFAHTSASRLPLCALPGEFT